MTEPLENISEIDRQSETKKKKKKETDRETRLLTTLNLIDTDRKIITAFQRTIKPTALY